MGKIRTLVDSLEKEEKKQQQHNRIYRKPIASDIRSSHRI